METTVYINTNNYVVSGESQVHKTEAFIKATRKFAEIDKFLQELAGGILLSYAYLKSNLTLSQNLTLKITSPLENITLFFKFGCQIKNQLNLQEKDIVFIKFIDLRQEKRQNDQYLFEFIKENKTFNVEITEVTDFQDNREYKKLYVLSSGDQVNFPLLNAEQRQIVDIEDQNVIVQGVAGSGKTNICINKIIFAACRGYVGKVLYTTYSRGLLNDTETKITLFRRNLLAFVDAYEQGRVIFTDKNHRQGLLNRLGVSLTFEDDSQIVIKIKQIVSYLQNKVDCSLLSDLYSKYVSDKAIIATEEYFLKTYTRNIKNHQLTAKLGKISHLSYEVVFKEIFGMIFGCYDPLKPQPHLSLSEYIEKRQNSFARAECEIIHSLAIDYGEHLRKNNLVDNNAISRALLAKVVHLDKYSLIIVDEVQDFSEVSLCLLKELTIKMFCVGDALQMINPSYFSFPYLKRLLFEKDVVTVAELKNNYRNTERIVKIIDKLGDINTQEFGTHSFVLKGQSVDSDVPTSAIYVESDAFVEKIAKNNFSDFTVVVADIKEKERLRRILKNQEILTVSEIKGLERDTVLLYNLLTDNKDRWERLERILINRKCADENSVYRYYFNLFYVGISRVKNHLFVAEKSKINAFSTFFKENFDCVNSDTALTLMDSVVSHFDNEQEDLYDRIRQFISLEQFDNARFLADKILDDKERRSLNNIIEVNETFIRHGKYRDAGIRFWELSMPKEAKQQFILSKDEMLCDLVDACSGNTDSELSINILEFFADVEGNDTARNLMLDVVKKDFSALTAKQKKLNSFFSSLKKKENHR